MTYLKKTSFFLGIILLLSTFAVVHHYAFAEGESTVGGTGPSTVGGTGPSTTGGTGPSTTGGTGPSTVLPKITLDNPFSPSSGIGNLCDLVNFILNIIAEIGAIVGVLFIIWSGFLFIKAQGNKEKIQQAKNTFYTTVLGIAILLGASVITKVIFNTISSVTSGFSGGATICNRP
jgi:hypothetical protein